MVQQYKTKNHGTYNNQFEQGVNLFISNLIDTSCVQPHFYAFTCAFL